MRQEVRRVDPKLQTPAHCLTCKSTSGKDSLPIYVNLTSIFLYASTWTYTMTSYLATIYIMHVVFWNTPTIQAFCFPSSTFSFYHLCYIFSFCPTLWLVLDFVYRVNPSIKKTLTRKRDRTLQAGRNSSPCFDSWKCHSHTSDDKWKQKRVMVVGTLTIWCSEINGHCEVNLSPETDEWGKGCC